MAVTLQDVLASLEVAIQQPDAGLGERVGWSPRDCGVHARTSIRDLSINQALAFLRPAVEMERVHGTTTAFADTMALFQIWIDQVQELADCPECGATFSRACTVNNHAGQAAARDWVHAARIPAKVGLGVLA